MNAGERELLNGLHAIASDSRGEAPVQIEERLVAEFRKRSRRRRARAWMSAGGMGAVAAAIALLVWIAPVTSKSVATQPLAMGAADEDATDFYPLPDADSLPPVESGLVVRVQLPMASLEMIGFPGSPDGATEPVEAEVLLGQDGLARGVRLVE